MIFNASLQVDGLKVLANLHQSNKKLTGGGKKFIAVTMRTHIANEQVQAKACRLLAKLATEGILFIPCIID